MSAAQQPASRGQSRSRTGGEAAQTGMTKVIHASVAVQEADATDDGEQQDDDPKDERRTQL